jgi:hypothetical protein
VAEHEEYVAQVDSLAERAAARGDVATQRWHLDDVERLKAMPFPWEARTAQTVERRLEADPVRPSG